MKSSERGFLADCRSMDLMINEISNMTVIMKPFVIYLFDEYFMTTTGSYSHENLKLFDTDININSGIAIALKLSIRDDIKEIKTMFLVLHF